MLLVSMILRTGTDETSDLIIRYFFLHVFSFALYSQGFLALMPDADHFMDYKASGIKVYAG